MQDQVNQLKKQVEELQKQLVDIERGHNQVFTGNLDDLLIERVIDTNLTGTSASNTLLRDITGETILNYPQRIMIYKWKGQRLALLAYDADKIIYT
jgi:hypothetical protein